jgi:putative transposase
MINHNHKLSLTRQAELLQLSRASVYYEPVGTCEADLPLMRRIDELHLQWAVPGQPDAARYAAPGRAPSSAAGTSPRRCERWASRRFTGAPTPADGIHLVRSTRTCCASSSSIDRTRCGPRDVTYIPMARGFVYLVAVMDWYSRKVLSWRISNSMTADFCVEALEEAIAKYGAPEIFNTDQGSQFTVSSFVQVLQKHRIQISMDGRGAWRDNVFVEPLWKSVKYEEVYLHAYDSVAAAKEAIGKYLIFYDTRRPHTALDRSTPDTVYFNFQLLAVAA